MAGVSQDTIKIVLGGTLATTQNWTTSLWMNLGVFTSALSQSQLDTIAGQIATPASAWAGQCANGWASSTIWNDLKVYWYPAGATTSSLVSEVLPTPVAGSSASSPLPGFTSCCVTLRTNTPARWARGRSYVPVTATTLNTSYQFQSSIGSQIGTGYKNFLQALNALSLSLPGGSNNKVSVVSFTRGVVNTVTKISSDNLPDTQHRRTDKVAKSTLFTQTI